VKLLKKLIETFTDPGAVVIDPCFGSGSTARAALETGRNFYGFEINKDFYRRAKEEMIVLPEDKQMSIDQMLKGEVPWASIE
jgi:site-specific DNA-methyltransferase (adenine-specific)